MQTRFDNESVFCVDMGTTKTQVWLVEGSQVWGRRAEDFGVRMVAQGRSKRWLIKSFSELLKRVQIEAVARGFSGQPVRILAAGMISSAQGLYEVPHMQAPASIEHLAAAVRHNVQIEGLKYPLTLVPGIRSGLLNPTTHEVLDVDLMRGEETLCAGLVDAGVLRPKSAVLNLGSHWKWIWIGEVGEISGSFTALTGEVIHAVQSNTLLASALPDARPASFDSAWVDSGFHASRSSGLMRAFFCVRLLEQAERGTAEQRLSFLYGAVIGSEIDKVCEEIGERAVHVVLCGNTPVATLLLGYLAERGIRSTVLSEDEKERAYLRGLRVLSSVPELRSRESSRAKARQEPISAVSELA